VVYFKEGRPIFVDSNLRNETLGSYLVSRKVIDEDQLATALKRARATSKKLGQVLIRMELIDEKGVLDALEAQTRLKLARALLWPDGSYVFVPGDDFSRRVPNCHVEPVELVLSALKKMSRAEDLQSLASELDQALRLTAAGERFLPQIHTVFPTPVLKQALSGISLQQTLGGDLDQAALLVQVGALRSAGLVEFTPASASVPATDDQPKPASIPAADDPEQAAEAAIPALEPVQLAPEVGAPPEPSAAGEAEGEEEEVTAEESAEAEEAKTEEAKAEEEISNIVKLKDLEPPSAEAQELAPPADLELFEPGEEPPPYIDEDESGVLQVPSVELELELEDPKHAKPEQPAAVVEQKEPEVEEVAPSEPPPEPVVEVSEEQVSQVKDFLLETYLGIHSKNYYQVLDVAPVATKNELEQAYREKLESFSGDKYDGLDLGEDEDKLIELNLIVEQAFTVLSDHGRRQKYDETLTLAKVQPAPAPDAFGAELYFQEGQALLKRKEVKGAVEAFRRAVEENPEQPDYHTYLGWGLFLDRGRGEAGALAARPHLEQAFQIAPDSATTHEFAGWIDRHTRRYDDAVDHLIKALKRGPIRMDIFEVVKDLLTRLGRYVDLEHQYRHLIFRLRDKEPEKTIPLWIDLAYLYLKKLNHAENAKVAIQVAAKMAPHEPRVQAAMNVVGSAQTLEWRQVAEGYRQSYRGEPGDTSPLHQLVSLHQVGERQDHALAAATILVHLGAASEEERDLFERLAPKSVPRASQPLDKELIESIRHPDDHPLVDELIGRLSPAISSLYTVSSQTFTSIGGPLSGDDRAKPILEILDYVQRQLGMIAPPLHWSELLGEEMVPLPEQETCLLVGSRLVDASEAVVAFTAARALSCVSNGRRHVFGHRGAELKTAFLAALTLCRPKLKVPDPNRAIDRFRKELQGSGVSLEALQGPLSKLLTADAKINLSQWIRAVRCSAARIGLMVSGDLLVALRAVEGDDPVSQDLIDFALGETYADLRLKLGISVKI
jgi:tetratricopeptide (TPR) repeat protein